MQTQIPDTATAPTPPSVPKAPSVPKTPVASSAPVPPAAPTSPTVARTAGADSAGTAGADSAGTAGSEWSFMPATSSSRPSGAAARPAADEAVGTVTAATAADVTTATGGVKGRVAKLASKVPFLRNRSTRELVVAGVAILAGLVPILAGLAIWATRTSPDIKALDPETNDVPAAYRPGGTQPNSKGGNGAMTGPDGISNFGDFESDYNPSDYNAEPWTSPSYKPYGTSSSDGDVDASGYYSYYGGGDASYYYSDPGTGGTAPEVIAPPPPADTSPEPGGGAAPPPPSGGAAPAPGVVPPTSAAGLVPRGGTVAWRWGALNGSAPAPASNVSVTATGDCRIVSIGAMRHATTICRDGAGLKVTKVTHGVNQNHTATLDCDGAACTGRISGLDMPTPMSLAGGTKVSATAGGGSLIELALAGWIEKIWLDPQGGVERIEHAIDAPFSATFLFNPTAGAIQSTAVYSR